MKTGDNVVDLDRWTAEQFRAWLDEMDPVARLRDCRCPIHGCGMYQVGLCDGGKTFVVGCQREDCRVQATTVEPFGVATLANTCAELVLMEMRHWIERYEPMPSDEEVAEDFELEKAASICERIGDKDRVLTSAAKVLRSRVTRLGRYAIEREEVRNEQSAAERLKTFRFRPHCPVDQQELDALNERAMPHEPEFRRCACGETNKYVVDRCIRCNTLLPETAERSIR
jgi:hypothetical protein